MPIDTREHAPDPLALRNAQALARLLDSSFRIPGTSFRFGLDPLVGIIPGIGDFAGVLLSTSILLSAARVGVPRQTLLRMATNIGLEALVGMVPIVGDLFDAAWKANLRNVALMEEHLAEPDRSARGSRRWLIATAAGLGALLLALVACVGWLLVSLLQVLGFG
jgi:hypothetical protein